jgi:hypothetical protein
MNYLSLIGRESDIFENDIFELFFEVLPELSYSYKGKFLDDKM